MPLYEYRCKQCKKVFSTIRPVSDIQNPTTCSNCGNYDRHTTKIGTPYFIFTGGLPSYEKENLAVQEEEEVNY